MSSFDDFIAGCKKEEIRFFDLKSLDLNGTLHHLTIPINQVDEELLNHGVGFDGSSYGSAKTENSDMVLIPDLETARIDPFRANKTISCFANIHLANKARDRFGDDVRFVCKKAETAIKDNGIADQTFWGPEFEFNIFEEASFEVLPTESYYMIATGETGKRNAYHSCNPDDVYADFRDDAVELIQDQGIEIRYHHHEVGSYGQQEIECRFNGLLDTGDNSVMIRYLLRNFAQEEGLVITFMPKPIFGQAGNGWHVHQFLKKDGKNIFYQEGEYANLSKTAQYYIGGILKHGPALLAFTNPSTNSFKRMVPGYEAPVALTYGQANRAGALRIPKYIMNPEETRVEFRPPDATSNPYLCLASMLMAGMDGIINKIDPVQENFGPFDGDPAKATDAGINFLPTSLKEALDALEADHEFLLRDGVFTKSLIEQWLRIKREEFKNYSLTPHPYEFEQYFDF